MYTAIDYIIAFSTACGHRIGALNDAYVSVDSVEFNEGFHDATAEELEKLRDTLEDHIESGTFMTSVFNKNVAASAHMFLQLLIEEKLEPKKQQEQTFVQEYETNDLPRDYTEGPDDDEDGPDDDAPADNYDYLEYANGLAEGDAVLRHEILPELLNSYEKFLTPQP